MASIMLLRIILLPMLFLLELTFSLEMHTLPILTLSYFFSVFFDLPIGMRLLIFSHVMLLLLSFFIPLWWVAGFLLLLVALVLFKVVLMKKPPHQQSLVIGVLVFTLPLLAWLTVFQVVWWWQWLLWAAGFLYSIHRRLVEREHSRFALQIRV